MRDEVLLTPDAIPMWTTWRWVAGYGITYVPYMLVTLSLKVGILPYQDRPASALMQLPIAAATWAVFAALWAVRLRWIQRLPVRTVGRFSLRFPTGASIAGGVSTSIVMISALFAYTAEGSYPLSTGIITRASVLVMAPIVDMCMRRPVGWNAWAALLMALTAISITLPCTSESGVPPSVALALALYAVAYGVRLTVLSWAAKTGDMSKNWAFFVGEHLSAAAANVLIAVLVLALARWIPGVRETTLGFRLGAATIAWTAVAGLAAELLAVFGGLFFVAPDPNTACVTASRCAGLVGITVATLIFGKCSSKVRCPSLRDGVAVAVSLFAIALLAVGRGRPRAPTPAQR